MAVLTCVALGTASANETTVAAVPPRPVVIAPAQPSPPAPAAVETAPPTTAALPARKKEAAGKTAKAAKSHDKRKHVKPKAKRPQR